MDYLLILITILTIHGYPLSRVFIHCEGQLETGYETHPFTDSRGRFVVQVQVGEHRCSAQKAGFQPELFTIDRNDTTIIMQEVVQT